MPRTTTLIDDIRELDNVSLFAMTPNNDAAALETIDPGARAAVLIGSERAGLSNELLALATPVRIPMGAGVDSLNAAAATAIACWELRIRR